MSIDYYIPITFCHLDNDNIIPIKGIHSFGFNFDRLSGNYKVWVGTADAVSLMPESPAGRDTIKLSEEDIDLDAIFICDGRSINCHVNKAVYSDRKHAYLIDFTFVLDKKIVLSNICPDAKDVKKKQNETSRFDLMDI